MLGTLKKALDKMAAATTSAKPLKMKGLVASLIINKTVDLLDNRLSTTSSIRPLLLALAIVKEVPEDKTINLMGNSRQHLPKLRVYSPATLE